MNRAIKFRAKRMDSNEWLFGSLFVDKNDQCYIKEPDGKLYFIEDKDTIGQFVNLKDKDGVEMYEDDIVECVSWNEFFSNNTTGDVMEPFRRRMYISFRNGGFKMIEPMPRPMNANVWDIIYNGDIKVIGNIHDNPELLKK